MKDSGNS